MLKCDFNKITFQHEFFSSKCTEFFRTPVHKNTSGGLLSNKIFYNKIQTLFYKFSNIIPSVINLEAFFANKLWTFFTEIWCFLIFIFFDLFSSSPYFAYLPLLVNWLTGNCFPLSLTNTLDWHGVDTLSFSL